MVGTAEMRYFKSKSMGIECIMIDNSTHTYPVHNHISVFTIGIVVCGRVRVEAGDRTTICEAGDTFSFRPYEPHSIHAEQPYGMLSICIDKEVFESSESVCLQKSILSLVYNNVKNKALISRGSLNAVFNAIELMKKPSLAGCIKGDTYIDNARKIIELNPEYELSIERMSREAFVSKFQFIRSFRREVGLTPHQFQIQNRVRKSQGLISIYPSITEVALTTGFCDQSHFIKQFEKIVGLTPSGYKNALINI